MTVLGSCVCACIYDPVKRVGGINHFVLPYGAEHASRDASHRYGEVAMRSLVDGLLRFGAKRENLVAKLYGGRISNQAETCPGAINIAFARSFLHDENIPLIESKLGGHVAQWVTFNPTTGIASVREAGEPHPKSRFDLQIIQQSMTQAAKPPARIAC
ncbi:chemotaxis protein CheD [Rhizobium helianthi]|uniref:Probable chemoreceptor glutamine deamidase CheD n=1 Tax=Rhizobium helianthi TaxID=1132695 RepID=A0ABW4M433_9HYPH